MATSHSCGVWTSSSISTRKLREEEGYGVGLALADAGAPACDPLHAVVPGRLFCADGLCRNSQTQGGGADADLGGSDMAPVDGARDMSRAGTTTDLSRQPSPSDFATGSSCAHGLCVVGTKLAFNVAFRVYSETAP